MHLLLFVLKKNIKNSSCPDLLLAISYAFKRISGFFVGFECKHKKRKQSKKNSYQKREERKKKKEIKKSSKDTQNI